MNVVEQRRSKNVVYLVLVVLLLGITVSSCYSVLNKEGFFLDEIFTFLSSNMKIVSLDDFCSMVKEGNVKNFEYSCLNSVRVMEFTQEDFMSKLSVPQGEGFNFFSVYLFQSIDVHPMLYYSIIHALSSITHSNDLKAIGFSVNIFFQLITCIFLFLMSRKIVNNPWISIIIVAYYGFSFGFQNDSTYFRMYCVLTCWITILCFLYYKIFLNGYNYSRRELFLICVIEYLALSTQYFSFVFIASFVAMISKNICHKLGKKRMYKFLKPHIVVLVLFVISWPQIIRHIISGSNQHAGFFSIYKLCRYVKLFIDTQFGCSLVLSFVFLLLLIYVLRCFRGTLIKNEFKRRRLQKFCFILVPCFVSYVVLIIISPWSDYRYVTFVMPIFSIFIVLVVSQFLFLLSRKFGLLGKINVRMSLLLVSVIVVSLVWRPVDNLPHINKTTPQKIRFSEKYCGIPAIILNTDETGVFIEIPYHNKHPYYVKIDNSCLKSYLSNLSTQLKDNKYILYINKSLNFDEVFGMLTQLGYSYNKVDYSTLFHDIYLIGYK